MTTIAHKRARKLVACGLIISPDERVLLTQRPAHTAHAGKWELPGGKIEPGESPEAALSRELFEELAVRVDIGRVWDVIAHAYEDFDVLLLIYPCRLRDGEVPRPVQVAATAWVEPAAAAGFDLLEADAPILQRLSNEPLPLTPGKLQP
ncbi:MAG TPA: (deoxy)nucleoside triphosphate pyrophosphohydrolase [Kofleriaceae bacterium]|nr:(deoxy)nucleoside triphosphate pyrophosphohydrolase [Kofleriaceae bacterium]